MIRWDRVKCNDKYNNIEDSYRIMTVALTIRFIQKGKGLIDV